MLGAGAVLFSGLYFVLMGRLSPLDGVGPKDIHLDRMLARATDGAVKEVVLATNFTNEGEATAHFIGEILAAVALGHADRARAAGRAARSSMWTAARSRAR